MAIPAARPPAQGDPKEDGPNVFPVSPYLLVPEAQGEFTVFLRQQSKLVLYASRGEQFTPAHRQRLVDMGVEQVYVNTEDKKRYDRYVESHLANVLADETIPSGERCRVWHDASLTVVREMFDFDLPGAELRNRYNRVRLLLKSVMRFISRPEMLRELSKLVAHGHDLHRHGLGVLVYTATLLNAFDGTDPKLVQAACMGALLHDLGKRKISRDILDTRPDLWTAEERRIYQTHPSLGVSLASRLPLSQETLTCILFHHEREDGQGYPSGALGDDIPFYPKVVALCNRFDNLTRGRAWREPRSPFAALGEIKADSGFTSSDILRRFILVLSRANMT